MRGGVLMIAQGRARVERVSSRRTVLRWPSRAAAHRLRQFAASAVWWVLSVGLVVSIWEVAAALNLINTVILPPPHLFIAEIQNQAQFLLPQVGARRIGANFVALTAIIASLRRILGGPMVAFVAALLIGSLAFYLKIFHKLTFPIITPRSDVARVLSPISCSCLDRHITY